MYENIFLSCFLTALCFVFICKCPNVWSPVVLDDGVCMTKMVCLVRRQQTRRMVLGPDRINSQGKDHGTQLKTLFIHAEITLHLSVP